MILNFRLQHTKKTNNTNKLPFCPYKNSKITKLKKNKKKKLIFVMPSLPDISRNTRNRPVRLVFKSIQNIFYFGIGACTSTVHINSNGWYDTLSTTLPTRRQHKLQFFVILYIYIYIFFFFFRFSLIEHIDNVLIKGVHELDWVGFGCFSI